MPCDGGSSFAAQFIDDETLFAAYTCMRERPHVVVCLRSSYQEWDYGVTYQRREAETAAAMEVLGCDWTQLPLYDVRPTWKRVEAEVKKIVVAFSAPVVYAPAPNFDRNGWTESDQPISGLFHHDYIGLMARRLFGDRVRYYQTYSRWHGRIEEGEEVIPTAEQVTAKLKALTCYQSQIATVSTRMHFIGSQREWMVPRDHSG